MSIRDKVLQVFSFVRKKPKRTFASSAFVDGLLGKEIRPICVQDIIDGRLEFVCWKCGEPEGLFSPDTAIDKPEGGGGAYSRLHKRCA